ncbi:capsule assembly Wzi family protein [Acinetobacter towneri]|uniref:capsule assembly Wzi family protein n=1 Tax=Acinetobacter towneri TaxID=202956 RepID=UPI00188BE14D|nr:capsule assembly Wzi family protein [Acinetobacter towneri]MBF4520664.1 capsule assembly Wzi family protein [Acinetobacter towneri]
MIAPKALLVTLALNSSLSFAQGIVLNDQNLRTDLNWLNQQGVIQISTSTWPMSGDEIQRALSQAKVSNTNQQKVIDAVVAHLNANNQLLKASLIAETDQKHIPQAFGDQQKAQYQAGLELNAGNQNWDAKIRVNAEKDPQIDNEQDVNVEGSYIAAKLWNQWLIAGQIPTYWGSAHDGSLIRGDASRPVYGVTMQRAEQQAFNNKWLSWIGPWQYQAFAGQLHDYDAVPDAKLIGLRVTAQPLHYLELGASRAIQWGGEGRPESFDSLWDAVIGKDNVYGDTTNPSNQVAGFDARLNLHPLVQVPMGVYAQYAGEDEAGGLPAKKMYLAGVDYSSSYQNMPFQLYTEWADTRTNGKAQGITYNHSVYKGGFYQHGYPLAHAVGGDGQMISVGGDIRFDRLNRVNARVMFAKLNESNRTTNQAFPEKDQLKALDLTWTHYLGPDIPLKLNGWISDSDIHGNDGGASIGIEFPLEKGLFSY